MGSEKRRLQRLDAILRHARRRREWPRHGEQRRLGKLDQRAAGWGEGELTRGRHVRVIRMARQAPELDEEVKTAVALEPIGPDGLNGREIGHAAAHLATLHRKEDRDTAAI